MNKWIVAILMLFCVTTTQAQGVVKGRVMDKTTSESFGYVNVVVTRRNETKLVKGVITDETGAFNIDGLDYGNYTLTVTYVGYKDLKRDFTLSAEQPVQNYALLYLSEDSKQLREVTVTGQRSSMRLEVDRKSFDVTQDIANVGGSASDVLENIPSVEVDNDGNISLRGNSSVEVWINGKASGLTSDNRAEILQQLPAESIERIEVIDNPSAKFSAEGSAGIINIILKKNRKAGYYGSLQAGVNTRGGANVSSNVNYNSSLFDAYFNVGFRYRKNTDGGMSRQEYLASNQYQNYDSETQSRANPLFTRAGVTWHATKKDDFTISGMMMHGKPKQEGTTPYHFGTIGAPDDTYLMYRRTRSGGGMHHFYGEFNYRHNFTDRHFIDFAVNMVRWKSTNDNIYQDSTTYFDGVTPSQYAYQYRPLFVNNRSWELKLDYENPINERLMLQAGYQGNFSHENTPQESWIDNGSWNGDNVMEDQAYYNRFIYDMDVHAFYATISYKMGKFGLMGGLRGEYWKVKTESYTWEQEHDATKRDEPFKKDEFQLFPSVFASYQFNESTQLQLNYTRRLRRPWGGELNSFRNTRDASMVQFGNPELTPEYSNSLSFGLLKTWTGHSLLISAYYRPTTDVIQRIRWQNPADGMMYQTNMNVAKSQSTGFEAVLKDKFFRILDLTTTVNAYYYNLDGFTYQVDGQTITDAGSHNFTWNARMQASLMLPYDITFQVSGNYRARQIVTQGYRKSGYSVDLGMRKNFFNKLFTLAVNCRDLFDSRAWEIYTSNDTFTRYQKSWRGGRRINLTLTWNFGNMKAKKKRQNDEHLGEEEQEMNGGYSNGE